MRDELDAWLHSERLKIESVLDNESTTIDAIHATEPTTTPELPPAASTATALPRRWRWVAAVIAHSPASYC
ncbi:hypothetical protein [Sphingomonas sp. CFBP 8760]|uniref:hypothetical protein n=1 Tax=Sphingomonas sp. CFBP 8760 TaxID=2775282 RepID=UPI0017804FB2|nr:hypothetical protein [Sphingomonas sp. CFBP 8760]MBD8548980.1 hypothetical protein [Sphingomonas sp. CFBP 8760]